MPPLLFRINSGFLFILANISIVILICRLQIMISFFSLTVKADNAWNLLSNDFNRNNEAKDGQMLTIVLVWVLVLDF